MTMAKHACATELESIAQKHGALEIEWLSASTVEVTFSHSHDRARAVREMKEHTWFDNHWVDPDGSRLIALVTLRQ